MLHKTHVYGALEVTTRHRTYLLIVLNRSVLVGLHSNLIAPPLAQVQCNPAWMMIYKSKQRYHIMTKSKLIPRKNGQCICARDDGRSSWRCEKRSCRK